jgi:hypothetical protein
MRLLGLLLFTSLIFPLPDDFQGKVVSIADNVNEQLVANGWAWHYKQYSTDAKLAQLEASAKAGGQGLWADPNLLPPWEFRSRQRSGTPPAATSASRSSAGSTEETGYWLNTNWNVRQNSRCQHYKNTRKGRACGPSDNDSLHRLATEQPKDSTAGFNRSSLRRVASVSLNTKNSNSTLLRKTQPETQ